MKSQDYFKKLQEQGKIATEDFTKFIETVPDFEIPDPVFTSIEDNFLTRERALVDPKIGGKIRAEVYDGVDQGIANILPLLPVFDAEDISKQPDTRKKVAMLQKAISNGFEKAKKENPNQEEKVKELNKNNQELLEKIKSINAEAEAKERDLMAKFEADKGNILLDFSLKDKTSKFILADEHAKLKEPITKVILADLREKNHLALSEDGQIVVQEIVNGVPKPKFNGNDPVTVDKLLETAFEPYLKRNNADTKAKDQDTGRKVIQIDTKPVGQETLADRRRAAYPTT